MAVTIRLSRKGRKKKPFYRIVVAESQMPRDGRFIEILGTYNNLTDPATIQVKNERALAWMKKGAHLSQTVRQIFKKKGVVPERSASQKTP